MNFLKDVIWYNSQLITDINKVMEKLKHPTYNDMKRIEVRFAKEMPYSYCVICNDVFWIENYHFGNIEGAEGYDIKTKQICIGGVHIHCYMFSTSSKYGKVIIDSYDRYFEF